MGTLRSYLVPLHREGHRFVAVFAVVTAVLFWLSPTLGWVALALTLWCAYFFRDPERYTPTREGLIVSPADGRVQSITDAVPPAELGMGSKSRPRISIFMDIFDAHVNRVPADGVVSKVSYRPGKFINASLDKASEDSERQAVRMTTADGKDIAFVQIAGLFARRIVCDLYEGREVRAGERFGMIRMGSRLDVYLDTGMAPLVIEGQRAVGGETVLADSRSQEPRRGGEAR